MDGMVLWTLAERLSNWFYDPLIFWAVPLGLALLAEAIRELRETEGSSVDERSSRT